MRTKELKFSNNIKKNKKRVDITSQNENDGQCRYGFVVGGKNNPPKKTYGNDPGDEHVYNTLSKDESLGRKTNSTHRNEPMLGKEFSRLIK